MSEPVQIIPALTILEDGGEFTVRVGEPKWATELGRQIVSLVAGLGIARKLTILTPNDVKVFKFNPPTSDQITHQERVMEASAPETLRPSSRISQDTSAPPSPESVGEYEAELARQAEDERIANEAMKLARQDANLEAPQVEEEKIVPIVRKRGRPSKVAEALKTASACGRCAGQGVLDGGGMCPVCRGQGAIAHYGRGR